MDNEDLNMTYKDLVLRKGEFDNLDSFFYCNFCHTEYQGSLDILQDEAEFEN